MRVIPALIFSAVLYASILQAQTYRVIYQFTGGADGGTPQGLTMDSAGNLYGAAFDGGVLGNVHCRFGSTQGCGTVFKLTPMGQTWQFNVLYRFTGGFDGALPNSITLGPDGNLYGPTTAGGVGNCPAGGCGTVYKVAITNCQGGPCPESILYRFTGGNDGGAPGYGDVIFDAAGNLYGTTRIGGPSQNWGVVYELTPSGDSWTETVLYAFTGGSDGGYPEAGLTLDGAGNLYGTTPLGGQGNYHCNLLAAYSCGVVFQLARSGESWTENVLYAFQGGIDGGQPFGGLIFDSQGNLYGSTTLSFGSLGEGAGTVFQLTPQGQGWSFHSLHGLPGVPLGPFAKLVMGQNGRLYGATTGLYGLLGNVFELAPSGGGWTYRLLHQFTGGADGSVPLGLALAPSGKLYGVASNGNLPRCEPHGCGVVFEITP